MATVKMEYMYCIVFTSGVFLLFWDAVLITYSNSVEWIDFLMYSYTLCKSYIQLLKISFLIFIRLKYYVM